MEFFTDPKTYYNALVSVVIGILTGVLASYIFLKYFLQTLKPSIEISNYICKTKREGQTLYIFKFINKTKYELFDVTLDLSSYKTIGAFGGQNLRITKINLKQSKISSIPTYNPKNDKHHTYAAIISTEENLNDFFKKSYNQSDYLKLTVIAKHSLSGLNKVFTQDFHASHCIKNKNFAFGDSLELINSK
ncbi:hypothetical protein [Myroides sp. DF42-4-2]|uniref:hypothetical protein n=1 Tax=Myroides sp. DF42-4-2 TaxID=2746726 RepID=UPI0025785288|nr:hypothetical protein [Myroides sp. DF42-4-2]MDM1408588.1 hypothetical protein [Myroides sp. DF42-4-2]